MSSNTANGNRNILLLITDQQTAHAMSCAGNAWLHTPAMDRLAARGTRFDRAYCAQPLCTPSRAAMFTGCYPHQVDATVNAGKFFWGHDIPLEALMGHHLSRAGYRCVYAGKDMPPADGSRDFELLCGWGDEQTADHLVRFLREDHEQPFLAVGTFVNPHNICEWASGRSMPEGDVGEPPPTLDLPPLPANHAPPPYEPQIIREHQQQGRRIYVRDDFGEENWRRYLWAYYRMVEMVDRQIGRVLDALEQTGLADSTTVIFASDHGDGAAAHQWNQKMVLYEESIRVPLILAGPGIASGQVDHRLVNFGIDCLPTLCDVAGAAPSEQMEGRSLLSSADGPSGWRDHIVVQTALNAENGSDNPQRNRGRSLIAVDGWKYTVYERGWHRETLVDLNSDPGEMVNLAVCRPYAERMTAMRAALADWCRRTGDPFRVPGHDAPTPEDRLR